MNFYDCIPEYVKFQMFQQYLSNNISNSVDYNLFKHNAFFSIFDLSTSYNSGLDFLLPSTSFGRTRLEVTFSRNLPYPLQMVCFSEYPSEIIIDKDRDVGHTYINTAVT